MGNQQAISTIPSAGKGTRRRRLKGIHSRSNTSRTGAEGLSFYYPRLLHCLNQMLAVVLSQHRVSSSKTEEGDCTTTMRWLVSCFLTAWAVNTSTLTTMHDTPKTKLPIGKLILMFSEGLQIGKCFFQDGIMPGKNCPF